MSDTMPDNKPWVDLNWYLPQRLFAEGYPEGLNSALRCLPTVRKYVQDVVVKLAARRVLEIGPGDAPLTEGVAGAVRLDISLSFLRALGGPCVRADLRAAPFAPKTFDLVVMADVLTHIQPEARAAALSAAIDLGRMILVFNSEWGAHGIDGSRLSTQWIAEQCVAHGLKATRGEFVHNQHERRLVMGLVVAA